MFPAWNRVVFDPVVDVGNARAAPDLFLDNHPSPQVLDEIQYCPELVPSLKRRIDRDRQPGRYILTGSQQWSVMAAISESLAGRAVFIDLDGFSLAEVCETYPGQRLAPGLVLAPVARMEQLTEHDYTVPWDMY